MNRGLLDMMMHYRGGLANTKVDVNLLFGFVRFNYDRLPLADGQRQGPIKVSQLDLHSNLEHLSKSSDKRKLTHCSHQLAKFSMFGKSLYDNKEQSNA